MPINDDDEKISAFPSRTRAVGDPIDRRSGLFNRRPVAYLLSPMATLIAARRALRRFADPRKANVLQRFFKAGKGEYAQGDRFLGVAVPAVRRVAKAARDLALADVRRLLASPLHEERLLALLILVDQFRRADERRQQQLCALYLRHRAGVNNWDLVDCSAEHILGPSLLHRKKTLLFTLAASPRVWDRRLAVMSTFHFIRRRRFLETLQLARRLLKDEHDLIHKALGWMLREIGKRDRRTLERFLMRYVAHMPRTMLRYAIERFPAAQRRAYLAGQT